MNLSSGVEGLVLKYPCQITFGSSIGKERLEGCAESSHVQGKVSGQCQGTVGGSRVCQAGWGWEMADCWPLDEAGAGRLDGQMGRDWGAGEWGFHQAEAAVQVLSVAAV